MGAEGVYGNSGLACYPSIYGAALFQGVDGHAFAFGGVDGNSAKHGVAVMSEEVAPIDAIDEFVFVAGDDFELMFVGRHEPERIVSIDLLQEGDVGAYFSDGFLQTVIKSFAKRSGFAFVYVVAEDF